MDYTAVLILEDKTIVKGWKVGSSESSISGGELCFNTSQTGYQESITDPSYAGQIMVFSFPHIGNVGVNEFDDESKIIFTNGIVLGSDPARDSSWRSENNLNDWMCENNLVGICGIDTRALVKSIREKPQNALIVHASDSNDINDKQWLFSQVDKLPKYDLTDLTKEVTCKAQYVFSPSKKDSGFVLDKVGKPVPRIVVIDFGIKRNILNNISNIADEVVVMPATVSFDEISKLNPDGVLLSNGPGDPRITHKYVSGMVGELINSGIPILGICFGFQLLALALGGEITKMKQGHRGINQPVKNVKDGSVSITSHNHGFALKDLTQEMDLMFVSLFDSCIEGFAVKDKPIIAIQYHPEASPGPHDASPIFKEFLDLIHKNKKVTK